MTSSPGPGWWLATDGSWYPPEAHPDVASRPRVEALAGARVSGPARRPSIRPADANHAAPLAPEPPAPVLPAPESFDPEPPAPEPLAPDPIFAEPLAPTAPVAESLAPVSPIDAGANDLISMDGAFDAVPEPSGPSAVDELLAAVDTSTAASQPPPSVTADDPGLIPLEAPVVKDTAPLQEELDPMAALSRFLPEPKAEPASTYVPPDDPLEHDPLAAVTADTALDDYDEVEKHAGDDEPDDDVEVGEVRQSKIRSAVDGDVDVPPDAWDANPEDLAAELEGSQRSKKDQKRHEREGKKAALKESKDADKAAKDAKKQATKSADKRSGISALTVIVLLALVVVAGAYYWMFIREADVADTDGVRDGTISVFDLGVGNCIGDATTPAELSGEIKELPSVACTQPHQHEVFHIAEFEPASASFDIEAIRSSATIECRNRLEEILDQGVAEAGLSFSMLFPTEESWSENDRSTLCVVYRLDGLLDGPLAELS